MTWERGGKCEWHVPLSPNPHVRPRQCLSARLLSSPGTGPTRTVTARQTGAFSKGQRDPKEGKGPTTPLASLVTIPAKGDEIPPCRGSVLRVSPPGSPTMFPDSRRRPALHLWPIPGWTDEEGAGPYPCPLPTNHCLPANRGVSLRSSSRRLGWWGRSRRVLVVPPLRPPLRDTPGTGSFVYPHHSLL